MAEKINADNENRILSYLMRNIADVSRVEEKYFLNENCRYLFKSLTVLNDRGIQFTVENCNLILMDIASALTIKDIQDIHDLYTDFTDIDLAFDVLKTDWFKFIHTKKVLKEVLVELTDRGYPRLNVVKGFAEDLIIDIEALTAEKRAYNSIDLVAAYRAELKQRDLGLKERSLGLDTLNRMIERPCQEGEITTFFGESGSGKSTFVKAIENVLINSGVCVLSGNLEMGLYSTLDRLVAIREGINLKVLKRLRDFPEERGRVEKAMQVLEEQTNLMYLDASSLSIAQLEYEIQSAKNQFRKFKVLPADEYMVVSLDLASMMTDFGELTPNEIELAMNKLHRVARKHHVHIMIVIQANENKIRNMKMFKKPEEIDNYYIGLEDVKGGAAYKERSRVVIGLHRPVFMKKKYFPSMKAIWEAEPDIIQVHLLKQNDGDIGYAEMVLLDNFRIANYIRPDTVSSANAPAGTVPVADTTGTDAPIIRPRTEYKNLEKD